MTPHTPGPWQIRRYDARQSVIIPDPETGQTIAMVGLNLEDARLIAAAPDMLEALEAYMNAANPQGASPMEAILIHDKMRKAIEKARGGK